MKAIANPPQVSTSLFGSTAVFGLMTGRKPQGKTGQGVSAADFFPVTTAGGTFQGITGQGVSAAIFFFPQGHQDKKEAKAHGVSSRGHQNNKEVRAHDVRKSRAGLDEDSYTMAHASVGYVVDANSRPCETWPTTGPSGGRRHAGWQGTRGPQRPLQGGPARPQTMRPGYGTFGEIPRIRAQSSPTEHRNRRTWWL